MEVTDDPAIAACVRQIAAKLLSIYGCAHRIVADTALNPGKATETIQLITNEKDSSYALKLSLCLAGRHQHSESLLPVWEPSKGHGKTALDRVEKRAKGSAGIVWHHSEGSSDT
jgi:hypothetical protein